MTTEEALDFLRQHQPMPDDEEAAEEVAQEIIDGYENARKHFLDHPDVRCVPLFLNSFGDGTGWGIYQMVDEVLWQFSEDEVVPHLLQALASPLVGVRYWNTQIAMDFPSPRLIPTLTHLVDDPDRGVRCFAIFALSLIPSSEVLPPLQHALATEKDEKERTTIRALLKNKKREMQVLSPEDDTS